MGNFCPHAAASPKSVREYEYIVYSCTIGNNRWGEVYLHFWQISAPPGICLSFETGGKSAKREKNECDGKTTNLVVAKKKGGNRLTSIFFMSAPPTKRAMCPNKKSTLAARGLGTCANYPDFCNNGQFYVI
jgi:hypothetical protein